MLHRLRNDSPYIRCYDVQRRNSRHKASVHVQFLIAHLVRRILPSLIQRGQTIRELVEVRVGGSRRHVASQSLSFPATFFQVSDETNDYAHTTCVHNQIHTTICTNTFIGLNSGTQTQNIYHRKETQGRVHKTIV